MNASAQQLGNGLNVESAVTAMAAVTSVVHEERNNLVSERDGLI